MPAVGVVTYGVVGEGFRPIPIRCDGVGIAAVHMGNFPQARHFRRITGGASRRAAASAGVHNFVHKMVAFRMLSVETAIF